MRILNILLLISSLALATSCSDDGETTPYLDGQGGGKDSGLCSALTCSGCCAANGMCMLAMTKDSCGRNGNPCVKCTGTQTCVSGQCSTGGCTCPTGCCQNGQCTAGISDSACGKTGGQCAVCKTGQKCVAGICVTQSTCGSGSCTGCCQGNSCVSGTSTSACGIGGATCKTCGSGETCQGGGCTKPNQCTPSNCTGCCSGGQCKTGNTTTACGTGGAACSSCKSGETCSGGKCTGSSTCGPGTCNGCCKAGLCLSGTSASDCGTGGAQCSACKTYQKCVSGACKLDSTSKWDIVIYSAKVDSTTKTSWDTWPANGAPDPYIEITVGTKKGTTKVLANTWTPQWNEVVLQGLSAGDITNYGMGLVVYDDDATWDQKMGECKLGVKESVLVAGGGTAKTCPDASKNVYVKDIVFKFNKK